MALNSRKIQNISEGRTSDKPAGALAYLKVGVWVASQTDNKYIFPQTRVLEFIENSSLKTEFEQKLNNIYERIRSLPSQIGLSHYDLAIRGISKAIVSFIHEDVNDESLNSEIEYVYQHAGMMLHATRHHDEFIYSPTGILDGRDTFRAESYALLGIRKYIELSKVASESREVGGNIHKYPANRVANPVDFLCEHYADELSSGSLTLRDLRSRDESLYRALKALKRSNPIAIDNIIAEKRPPKRKRNKYSEVSGNVYRDRTNKGENSVAFLRRVYAVQLDSGELKLSDLDNIDPILAQALRSWNRGIGKGTLSTIMPIGDIQRGGARPGSGRPRKPKPPSP